MAEYKTIYSLKVKIELKKMGIEPVLEKQNPKQKHLLCWVYANDSRFQQALDKIWGGINGA